MKKTNLQKQSAIALTVVVANSCAGQAVAQVRRASVITDFQTILLPMDETAVESHCAARDSVATRSEIERQVENSDRTHVSRSVGKD